MASFKSLLHSRDPVSRSLVGLTGISALATVGFAVAGMACESVLSAGVGTMAYAYAKSLSSPKKTVSRTKPATQVDPV